jgi:DNA-binding beta-propeller fold protein YncE
VKAWLSRHQVPFTAHSLTEEANRAELLRRNRGSPLTLFGDEEIVGYDPRQLLAALKRFGLERSEERQEAAGSAGAPLVLNAPLSDGVACTGFLDSRVTLIDARRGRYLGKDRASSSIPMSGCPISIAVSRAGGSFMTANHEAGTVTFLSLADGSYLNGSLEQSTQRTGDTPMHALAHPDEPLFYVSNGESCDLTAFDARSGGYAFGGITASRVALPGKPGTMALDAAAGILYVRIRAGFVTMLDARTLRPLKGDFDASSFSVGLGRGIALSADGRVLHVPRAFQGDGDPQAEGLAVFDARTGKPLDGTPERSLRRSAPVPFAVVAHPRKPIVYVACLGAQVVELRDSATGEYLHGTAEASTVRVGPGARGMTVDPRDDCLYVASFDESLLYMFDAVSGAWRFGSREASTLPLDQGPRDMCVLG